MNRVQSWASAWSPNFNVSCRFDMFLIRLSSEIARFVSSSKRSSIWAGVLHVSVRSEWNKVNVLRVSSVTLTGPVLSPRRRFQSCVTYFLMWQNVLKLLNSQSGLRKKLNCLHCKFFSNLASILFPYENLKRLQSVMAQKQLFSSCRLQTVLNGDPVMLQPHKFEEIRSQSWKLVQCPWLCDP